MAITDYVDFVNNYLTKNGMIGNAANINKAPDQLKLELDELNQSIGTLGSTAVKLTGNQTIAGVKTFSSNIVGNITGNSGTATTLLTARTINGVSFDGSANITVSDSTAVKLTGNGTIAGVKTFSSSPIVPTPTTEYQVATKKYVDDKTIINNLTDKPTPIDTDHIGIQETSGLFKKLSWTNLKATLKTYFDTIYGNWIANDSRAKIALNASGEAPIYACRAWVNFNGTGTVAIRASGNVSSITDNGVGRYRVNFVTSFSDGNYAVSFTSGNFENAPTINALGTLNQTETGLNLQTSNIGGSFLDSSSLSVSIII